MSQPGITLSQGTEGSRLEIECPHQSGVLYTVPGEASWVCSKELLHAHALAGFMRELVKMDLPQVNDMMQRWGVYYRERPVASTDGKGESESDEGSTQETA